MINNLVRLKKFWKGKRVFLTGHTGFKGSWLCIMLNFFGAKVIGYSLKPTKEDIVFKSCGLEKLIENSIIGDIRDYKKLKKSIKLAKPDTIIHLAAQALVRESYKSSKYTFDVNIGGTINILEIAKELNLTKSILIVTSDKVYKNKDIKKMYVENDLLGGLDPYSNSKACVEMVADSYNKSFFLNNGIFLATARAGNVIGGGDMSKDRIIPDYIRALKNKKSLIIRSPKAIRPWQHVFDPLIGYLNLTEQLMKKNKFFCQPWNFGPKKSSFYPVIDVIKIINKNFNNKVIIKINKKLTRIFKETNVLMLNSKKANLKLKWIPRYGIRESLSLTADWYRAYLKKSDILKFSQNQIKNYFAG